MTYLQKECDEGFAAGMSQMDVECPYAEGTDEYNAWWDGYDEASDEIADGED